MKLVYIAGPYNAPTPWDVEQNVRRAEELALGVAWISNESKIPFGPVCPHTQSRFFAGQLDEQYWIKLTMEMMRRCDAVLLVDRWEKSSGTLGEIEEAGRLEIPVFQDLEDLLIWTEEQEGTDD